MHTCYAYRSDTLCSFGESKHLIFGNLSCVACLTLPRVDALHLFFFIIITVLGLSEMLKKKIDLD